MGANKFIYASAVRIGALKFIATMCDKRRSSIGLNPNLMFGGGGGATITVCIRCPCMRHRRTHSTQVKWRGKPVFIRHRTADEIAQGEPCRWTSSGTGDGR